MTYADLAGTRLLAFPAARPGMVPHSRRRVRDGAEYRDAIGDDEAVAIDYLVGDVSQTGGGLGPQLIWRYLLDVVRPAHPSASRIVARPDPANTRSIRALEKAGFTSTGRILDREEGPEQLGTFEVAQVLGT